MTSPNGKLYLIPTPLGDCAPDEVLPRPVLERIGTIRTWVVEELRSARRFLSAAGWRGHVEELDLHLLNEHSSDEEVEALGTLFREGNDVGLITEAGLPAVADPGARLVALCHRHGISVIPYTGPSSLMLALMGSGLNGQRFAFLGYLPAKTDERRSALHQVEKRSAAADETAIFIETPYRNDTLLADILSSCKPSTRLCIAADLSLPHAFLQTRSIAEWKRAVPVIGKRPCVFLLLAR